MTDKYHNKKNSSAIAFGLDIGIASIGWAVLAPDRIIDLGVRIFDKAETAKEGESLNKVRRDARLMRRRLQRRTWRLTKLARLLKHEGLLDNAKLFKQQQPFSQSLWRLRVAGLDRLLNDEEWARVIYHLCKHRGYHWVSRAEEKSIENNRNGEGGKVRQGLARTKQLMQKKNYRSAAEMALAEFPDAQRNKQGDYGKALSRALLAEELKTLFERQRQLGHRHAGKTFEAAILGDDDKKSGLFWLQKPALAGEDLLKMLGRCIFEKEEYRAPRASFTAERHIWLTRLNNLRIVLNGITRPLSIAERAVVLHLPYQQVNDLTYQQLRKALVNSGLSDSFRFAGLAYPNEQQNSEGKVKNPEDEAILIKLPAWQLLRKTLQDRGLDSEWQYIALPALIGQSHMFDQIAQILTVYKDDDDITKELHKLALPNKAEMIEALGTISFKEFHTLSLKALYKIVPSMEIGLSYAQACKEAGYHPEPLPQVSAGPNKYLPPFYAGRTRDGRMVLNNMAMPRNPVVVRALNQARKVINTLIRLYGVPHSVQIEMARDLSRSFDERKKIEKVRNEFRAQNEKDKASFVAEFGLAGTTHTKKFQKYQLYHEQQGKCAYSLEPLDLQRVLFEQGYAEIDHVLPFSRSFDDSKNNRVLVMSRENRNKGNQTPYEYLEGASNSERWQQFEIFAHSNQSFRQAKRNRLLKKDFQKREAAELRQRNLYDSRYPCRFFKNYVERYLQLNEDNATKRCMVVNGQLIAFLQARWRLIPLREKNDRRHALDATVIAACTQGMVDRVADYSRSHELAQMQIDSVFNGNGAEVDSTGQQKSTEHFPQPWSHFFDELKIRLNRDEASQLRMELGKLGTYPAAALHALQPLFVSRAPQRRNGGAAHRDTIYRQPKWLQAKGRVIQKVPLNTLTLRDLDKLIDPHRNAKLYSAIRSRLEQHGGNGEKAFPSDNPLHKPGRNSNLKGPIVRSVKLVIDKLSGIPIRHGIAKNDTMLRVDIFTKAGKFHLVPVYVHHKAAKQLPNQAIVAFKDESEWTQIDDSFTFCFSLYPNDLIRVTQKGKTPILGYYASCHRGTGNINIWTHDRNPQKGKEGQIEGVGVKTALSIEKFHVDVLGRVYPARPEKRKRLT